MSVTLRLQEIDAALRTGDSERAIALAQAAVRSGLQHPFLFRLTAYALEHQGAYAEAVVFLRRGLALTPGDIDMQVSLGICLGRVKQHVEALQVFRRVLRAQPDRLEAHYGMAEHLAACGDAGAARLHYERVARLAPEHHEPRAALALLCARTGDLEAARDHAARVLAAIPGHPIATCALACAEIGDGLPGPAEERLSALLREDALAGVIRATALGLLADARDAQDRCPAAFEAYETANRLLEEIHGADWQAPADAFARRLAALPAWLEAAFGDRAPARPETAASEARIDHVFLVGFPRSGTTLLEQVLATHPDVVTLEEQPTLAEAERAFLSAESGVHALAAADAATLEHHRQAYWKRVEACGVARQGKTFVDKLPMNSTNLALIAVLFPHARILLARRDPRDVVLSCFRRSFSANAATFAMLDLERTAALYDAVMTLVEACRSRFGLNLHEVRYERLVADFGAETRRVCEVLRLDQHPGMADFAQAARRRTIATPSAVQVRRGLYRDGVDQWRRYKAQMARVLPCLEPWILRLGYPRA